MSDGERSVKLSGIYRLRGMEDVESLPRELELEEYARLFDRTFYRTGVTVGQSDKACTYGRRNTFSSIRRWWLW